MLISKFVQFPMKSLHLMQLSSWFIAYRNSEQQSFASRINILKQRYC